MRHHSSTAAGRIGKRARVQPPDSVGVRSASWQAPASVSRGMIRYRACLYPAVGNRGLVFTTRKRVCAATPLSGEYLAHLAGNRLPIATFEAFPVNELSGIRHSIDGTRTSTLKVDRAGEGYRFSRFACANGSRSAITFSTTQRPSLSQVLKFSGKSRVSITET